MDWTVLVPVKPPAAAKSRLRGAVTLDRHADLALAMATDTLAAVSAAAAVHRVIVITNDPSVRAAARDVGAEWAAEPPGGGLNDAVNGTAAGTGSRPAMAVLTAIAVLPADLPALRPTELDAALAAARLAGPRAFVADAAGSGTVLLAARGVPVGARFGPDSAARHEASGAVALTGDWPTLRQDVDTPADLRAAAAFGLGPRTRREYGAFMQGTVASFDPTTRAGTVLLDDGSELTFEPVAFDASGLRLLRLGQRVKIDRDGTGRVSRVTLPTLP